MHRSFYAFSDLEEYYPLESSLGFSYSNRPGNCYDRCSNDRVNRIPRAVWFIATISVLWSYVAIGHGQGITSTIWGLWLLFQFPFVCLFVYLQPNFPKTLTDTIRKSGLVLLILNVGFQLIQFFFGMQPGDDLAGLFGQNGVNSAVIFLLMVSCIQFGHWITTKKWLSLVVTLALGIISSVMGEIKLFLPAIIVIGLLAIVMYTLRHHAWDEALIYLFLIVFTAIGFVNFYNVIVPGATETPIETFINDPTKLSSYINQTHSYVKNGQMVNYIGRGLSVKIGWEELQKDPVILLFGYGIGSRSESQTLGIAGIGLSQASTGISGGTSLLVMMQELGLIGLSLLAGFIIWVILTLARDIRRFPDFSALELRYALLLFSLLWPVWLWYASAWTLRVPMCLYWFTLGYVLAEVRIALGARQNALTIKKLQGVS